MKFAPYLNFDGKTEEAFNFYKSVFGGEFSTVQKFKEVPGTPPEEAERIMHISLETPSGLTLMGSDTSPSRYPDRKFTLGDELHISLHPDSKEEGQKLYDALSEGGEIEMKYEKQFWGGWYAMFRDKYGIQWMINYQEDPLPGGEE
jgi:PhnB protein